MLAAVSAAVLKAGQMFLTGCNVGVAVYTTVTEATKKKKRK